MGNRKWTWRLAVGLSLLWLLGTYFLTESSDTLRLFLLAGVLPVIGAWVVYWVLDGFRQDKRRKSRVSQVRLPWRK